MNIHRILKILPPLVLASSSAFAQSPDTTAIDYRGADTVKVDDLSIIIDYRYTSENGIKKFYLNKFRCDEFDKLKKSINYGLTFPKFYEDLIGNFITSNPRQIVKKNGKDFSFTIEKSLCWSCNDAEKAIAPCGERQSVPLTCNVKYNVQGAPSVGYSLHSCINDNNVPCGGAISSNCFTASKIDRLYDDIDSSLQNRPFYNYIGR
jgi:hypothetical protein